MRHRRIPALAGIWLAATLACNLQSPQSDAADLAATVTANALTLQARVSGAIPGTPAATFDTGVDITSAAACRAGPGQAYELVFTADVGQTYKLVGKSTSSGHWIVENPAGGLCWLPVQVAAARGDTSLLPEQSLPPAPTSEPPGPSKTPKPSKTAQPTLSPTIGVPYTPGVPNFPAYVTGSRSCTSTMVAADKYWIQDNVLTWQDRADNETGYRIYVAYENSPGGLGDTLGPDANHYEWQEQNTEWVLQFSHYVQVWVVAFNDVGESIRMGTVIWRCPYG